MSVNANAKENRWMNQARSFARYSTRRNSSRFAHRLLVVGQRKESEPSKQEEAAQVDFGTNTITSSKYTWYNFFCKNLFEQFRRVANFYFLLMAIVQLSIDSPVNPITSISPLIFVVFVTMCKQGYEDYCRHRNDNQLNNKLVTVVKDWREEEQIHSEDIEVGDIVKVKDGESFPCDLVLLSSSHKMGKCSVKTANIDGETNLKERSSLKQTRILQPKDKEPDGTDHNSWSSLETLKNLEMQIKCKKPSANLNEFEGRMMFPTSNPKSSPLGLENLLMRGTQLKNTEWVYGCAVYTGKDTKMSMNSKKTTNKFSKVESTLNKFLIIYMLLLAAEVIISASLKYAFGMDTPGNDLPWYLGTPVRISAGQLAQDVLSFLVLYNYIIPISLYVTLEVQKFVGAQFFTWDKHLRDNETGKPAICNSSDLNEELGQVQILFSDKTGTLTQNIMLFKQASIAGIKYIKMENPDNSRHPYELVRKEGAEIEDDNEENIQHFLEVLSLCHTVQISDRADLEAQNIQKSQSSGHIKLLKNIKNKISAAKVKKVSEEADVEGGMFYTASSPDEKALVEACDHLGLSFIKEEEANHEDENESYDITVKDSRGSEVKDRVFTRLIVLEFDSTRKRMSVIVRDSENQLWLLTKGAETSIIDFCKEGPKNATLNHINDYAEKGLRTLAVAVKGLNETDYQTFLRDLKRAKESMVEREKKVTKVYNNMEKEMILLGATAVEDKLQDEVKETLVKLREAGISVWVLTGDKKETAKNISISCNHLVEPDMTLLDITKETAGQTAREIGDKLEAEAARMEADKRYALLVDGQTLVHILPNKERKADVEKDKNKQLLYQIGSKCEAVICCRMSPLQKSEIVKMMKESPEKPTTAAVGDGGNDVAMIQEAHVGLGIVGKEGKAATRAADFAFSQFMHLQRILLVHGHWYYYRVAILVQYFFYKNVACFTGQVFYTMFNNFSTQSLYGSLNLTLYNIVFTSLPIFVFGLVEQNISEEDLLKRPQMYKTIANNNKLSWTELLLWFVQGLWHSVVTFFGWWLFWSHQESGSLTGNITNGEVLDRCSFGFIIYTSVVIVVNIKLLIEASSWSFPLVGSILLSMAIQPLIGLVGQTIFNEDDYKVIYHTVCSLPIWLFLLSIVVVCLLPDLAFAAMRQHWKDQISRQRQQISSPKVELLNMKTLSGFENKTYNGSNASIRGNLKIDYNENQNYVTIV